MVMLSMVFLLPLVLFADSLGHLFLSKETIRRWEPDWVIMRRFGGSSGLPIVIHRLIGVLGIITSALLWYFSKTLSSYTYYYIVMLSIFALVLILTVFAKLTTKTDVKRVKFASVDEVVII